jgi:phage terminase large subunit-like protein
VSKDFVAIARQYADDVLSGKISVCRLVQLACQRQVNDLAKAETGESEWTWDEDRANRICAFIELLPHIKGRWKSRTIILEPWQCFSLTTIFGWVDDDGLRRFRKVYWELPRKNSKTTIAAGVALYLLCADGEPGADIFAAAVTHDQAKICWDTAAQMVKNDKNMRAYYNVEAMARSIVINGQASSFKPLARDADSLEGLNPHGAVIDELHAHKTREVFDVINMATGSRSQPLIFCITTAGDNRNGVCFEQHDYIVQVLNGRASDRGSERYFGIIYSLDPSDDWTTEESARKANPNYGVSVFPDDIMTICQQAQRSAEAQNTYLTKRLNIWVTSGTAYFNMLAWENRCKSQELKLEDFYGERCYIGIDLASKIDVAAKVYVFPRDDGKMVVFGRYYLPTAAAERGNPNYDLYRGWSINPDVGLTLTEGEVIDFEVIEEDLKEDRGNFDVAEFPYDPNQATELSTRMRNEGLNMVEITQNVRNLSEPMKSLEGMVLAGDILHNGDPILSWMMGNVVAKRDAKDNVYPRKIRNENKIDGAVALIMALARANIDEGGSVYETRGLASL